jgi:hypothetical protein
LVSADAICTEFETCVLFAAVALVIFNVSEDCKKPKPDSLNVGMITSIAKEKQIRKYIKPTFLLII